MKLLKALEEMHAGVHGLDNFDRAIEMINSAVDHHDRNDNFDAIADVDGLVQFLKGQYHDFTPALEDSVREIIADELGHDKPFTWGEEEEEKEWKAHAAEVARKRPQAPTKKRTRSDFYRTSKRGIRQRDAMVKAAHAEEEELNNTDRLQRMRDETKQVLDDSRKRKMARKYAIHGPSRRGGGIRRRDLGKSRGTFGLEQEEEKKNWHTDWTSEVDKFRERRRNASVEQEEVASLSDRRTRRDRFRTDARGNRSGGHRHSDPMRRHAQLMARKARPHVGLEQEEWNLSDEGKKRREEMRDTDWNKEIDSFRKRRKTVEPKYARRPSRLTGRRRSEGPSGNAFSMRFESFKQFNEMYRDSQHGLTIDLSGPEGNAFVLLGHAKSLAKQLDWNGDAIVAEMQESDYDHLVATFEKHFANVVTLINKPGEDQDEDNWDE